MESLRFPNWHALVLAHGISVIQDSALSRICNRHSLGKLCMANAPTLWMHCKLKASQDIPRAEWPLLVRSRAISSSLSTARNQPNPSYGADFPDFTASDTITLFMPQNYESTASLAQQKFLADASSSFGRGCRQIR
jgi:hypothetical protein